MMIFGLKPVYFNSSTGDGSRQVLPHPPCGPSTMHLGATAVHRHAGLLEGKQPKCSQYLSMIFHADNADSSCCWALGAWVGIPISEHHEHPSIRFRSWPPNLPISHQIQPTPQGHDVALAETLPVFHVPSWVVQNNHRRTVVRGKTQMGLSENKYQYHKISFLIIIAIEKTYRKQALPFLDLGQVWTTILGSMATFWESWNASWGGSRRQFSLSAGYESKPWYPAVHTKTAGKWMFIPIPSSRVRVLSCHFQVLNHAHIIFLKCIYMHSNVILITDPHISPSYPQ